MNEILIIEPQPDFRATLKALFRQNWPQLQVAAVDSWTQAQSSLNDRRPDLVITALSLPDCDAPVERLIEQGQRVVVLTDVAQMAQAQRYRQPQVLDWVVREFSTAYLQELVQRLLDNRHYQVLLVGEAAGEELVQMLHQMNLNTRQVSSEQVAQWNWMEHDLVLLQDDERTLSWLQHIRRHRSRVSLPVIVLNGHVSKSRESLLLKAGASDLIGQPCSLDEVMLRVHNQLNYQDAIHHMAHLAVLDPLTELYNRNFLYQMLPLEISEAHRYDKPLSVMMLDVDHFKRINDTGGHEMGDRALKQVADHLRRHLREADIACRYGGEEFLLVMPQTPLENAVRAAEKIRIGLEGVSLQDDRSGAALPLTVSVGVAALKRHENLDDFIRRADQALYAAKRNGRNRVEIAR